MYDRFSRIGFKTMSATVSLSLCDKLLRTVDIRTALRPDVQDQPSYSMSSKSKVLKLVHVATRRLQVGTSALVHLQNKQESSRRHHTRMHRLEAVVSFICVGVILTRFQINRNTCVD